MASRASSDIHDSVSPASIPSLPGLGTTWYRRGTRYWLRRTFTAIVWLLVLAMFCFFVINIYEGFISEWSTSVRIAWNWTQVVACCVGLVWGWLSQRRDLRTQLLNPPTPGEFRERKREEGRRTRRLSYSGRFLVLLAAPVMPAVAAWIVGWSIAMLTVREYPSEVGARRSLPG